MPQLVTLAHRVSRIHSRYVSIHDAFFSISFFKHKSRQRGAGESIYMHHEIELKKLIEDLTEVSAIINSGAPLEPKTTFSREFAQALEEYIQALSISIIRLSEIYRHQCSWDEGAQPYNSNQSRIDRTGYDQSIQHYRRLGARLNQMVTRL